MNKKHTFWLLGGDLRQIYLARLLTKDGHRVFTYATSSAADATDTSGLSRADCVVFPLPVCARPGFLCAPLAHAEQPIDPLLDLLCPGQLLYGGRPDGDTLTRFAHRGLVLTDYFAREELTVANAVPTAEGAVQLAMEHLPVTIHRLPVLILGYGRVGRVCARCFAALGAHVTVAARRSEQLVWADAEGHSTRTLPLTGEALDGFGLVINTAPALVLPAPVLSALSPECLIIDLASGAGGVEPDGTRDGNCPQVIHALSLPGRVAPLSAAGYIRDTLYRLLDEAQTNSGKEDRFGR